MFKSILLSLLFLFSIQTVSAATGLKTKVSVPAEKVSHSPAVLALLKKNKSEKASIAFFEKGELAYQAGNFERAKAAFMLVGENSTLKVRADGYIESMDAEEIKALELMATRSEFSSKKEQPETVDEVIIVSDSDEQIVSDSDEQIVKSGSADGSSLGVMGSAAAVVLGVGFNTAIPIVGGLASIYYFSD
jgi:hypothetical protein